MQEISDDQQQSEASCFSTGYFTAIQIENAAIAYTVYEATKKNKRLLRPYTEDDPVYIPNVNFLTGREL